MTKDERLANIDALIDAIKRDELDGATHLTIMDYAKLRNLYPQRVYKAVREAKLGTRKCDCGRKVIDVLEADILFKVKTEEE